MSPQRCPHCNLIFTQAEIKKGKCPSCKQSMAEKVGGAEKDQPKRGKSGLVFILGLALGLLVSLATAAVAWIAMDLSWEKLTAVKNRVPASRNEDADEAQTAANKIRAETNKKLKFFQERLAKAETISQKAGHQIRSLEEQKEELEKKLEKSRLQINKLNDLIAATKKNSFVHDWLVLGPLDKHRDERHNYSAKILDQAIKRKASFKGVYDSATWKTLSSNTSRINFAEVFEEKTSVTCYAVCWVLSEKKQTVTLSIGSDDGVYVWLNGRKVHENKADRAAEPGQDKVRTELQSGWNQVITKVYNNNGDWDLYFEFRTEDNSEPLRLLSTNLPPETGEE